MLPGRRIYPKWVQPLFIPGMLALSILINSCHGGAILSPFSSNDVFAVAFPADLPPSELETVFLKHGIDPVINENNLLVPMTDFVSMQYLPLSEFSRRVQADDPRQTPLSSLLVSAFTTAEAEDSWRIWYVPIASSTVYRAIQNVFLEIGGDWAWDAQLPSPVLRFLWTVWLAWIWWLFLGRQVKDRLYHVVLILAWFPLAFFLSLPAAALMVVGQGMSTILGMKALAIGRNQGMTRSHIYRLLGNLAPFLISMLFLVAIDTKLLIPVSFSIALTIPLLVHRVAVLRLFTGRRMHRYPQFTLILEDSIRLKVCRIGFWTIIPLAMLVIVLLIVPYKPKEPTVLRLAYTTDVEQSLFAPDYTSMIRSHATFQEALAWGRLGDASWLVNSYSLPYRFEMLDNRIVRSGMDSEKTTESFQQLNELDRTIQLVLEHTRGGTPMVVSGGDIPGIRRIQLDSLGVVFYIMALAPFCVLGLHRVSQSRRRSITSYTNRQVA